MVQVETWMASSIEADFSEKQWKELYEALRGSVSEKEEMTKKKFVTVVYKWLKAHSPKSADRIKPYLGKTFDKYLDADHNGTVSVKELEDAIAAHIKSRGK